MTFGIGLIYRGAPRQQADCTEPQKSGGRDSTDWEERGEKKMISDSFDTPIGKLNPSSKLSECCSSSCRIVHSSRIPPSRALVCDQRNEHQIY